MEFLESEETGAVDNAFRHLQEMIRKFNADRTTEKPDHALLEKLLASLVSPRHGDPQATALQAQQVVSEMESLHETTKDSDVQPSPACYSNLLQAWSRTSNMEQMERVFWEQMLGPKSMKQAADSLESNKIKPNVLRAILGQSLNRVLGGWAFSNDALAGRRCDAVLSKLHRIQFPNKEITVTPNPESYQHVNVAWMSATQASAAQLRRKDFLNAAKRVEVNVGFMMKRYEGSNRNEAWLPDPDCYSWLIFAYGHGGAADKAQAILDRLIAPTTSSHVPAPTTNMYNAVLEAWARQGKGKEAGILLSKWVSRCQQAREAQLQQEQQQDDDTQSSSSVPVVAVPNQTSCLLVIHAWGRFPDHYRAPQAENILRRMQELQKEEDPLMRVLPAPTVETFNAVIQAYGRSRHYKLHKPISSADRLLDEMNVEDTFNRNNPVAPNPQSYEMVIETWARFGYRQSDRRRKVGKLVRKMKFFKVAPTERCLKLVEICQEDGKTLEEDPL